MSKPNPALIDPLIDLIRMASVRNIRILAIETLTSHIPEKDDELSIDTPYMLLGIEIMPNSLHFKSSLGLEIKK